MRMEFYRGWDIRTYTSSVYLSSSVRCTKNNYCGLLLLGRTIASHETGASARCKQTAANSRGAANWNTNHLQTTTCRRRQRRSWGGCLLTVDCSWTETQAYSWAALGQCLMSSKTKTVNWVTHGPSVDRISTPCIGHSLQQPSSHTVFLVRRRLQLVRFHVCKPVCKPIYFLDYSLSGILMLLSDLASACT